MGMQLTDLLLIVAFVLFVVATFAPPTKVNLVAAGLAFALASVLLQ